MAERFSSLGVSEREKGKKGFTTKARRARRRLAGAKRRKEQLRALRAFVVQTFLSLFSLPLRQTRARLGEPGWPTPVSISSSSAAGPAVTSRRSARRSSA